MVTQHLPSVGVGDLSRRQLLRALLVGSAGVAVPGLLSGCGQRETPASAAPSATPVAGGTVTWGKSLEATQLDPVSSSLGSSWDLIQIVYDTLVSVDDKLNVVPGLAEWATPSPTTYVFTLRQGPKFSNGRPLTADDVVGTFRRILDPESGSGLAGWIGTDTRVEKVDDRTVRFTLAQPLRTFLPALTGAAASILPIQEIESRQLDPTRALMGTGPFMVESHQENRRWELVPNPHASEVPQAKRLVIEIITDTNARIAALRDGSIDFSEFSEPDAKNLLAGVPGVTVDVQERTDFHILQLNTQGDTTPFSDARVRQAIAYGIDRDRIRNVALGGIGELTGVISATFGEEAVPPTITRDTAKAKSLLAEAGRSDLRFEIIYPSALAGNIAQVIQQSLAEIGVEVKTTSLEQGVWVQRAWVDDPAKMDATVAYYAAYAGPTMAMVNWSPKLAAGFGEGFEPDDPKITEVILAAWQAPDAQAAETARAAALALEEQASTIPLVTRPITIAYRSDKIRARIAERDGNIDPMRYVADFTTVR